MRLGKKIFNGVTAYFMFYGLTMIIAGVLFILMGLTEKDMQLAGIAALILLGGIAMVVIITLILKQKTQPQYFKMVWLNCVKNGFRWFIKVTLLFTIIFIPFALGLYAGYITEGITDYGERVPLRFVGDGIYEDPYGRRWEFR